MLRESSSQSGLADYDLGPSELGFQLSEPELQSHQQHEINKLRERLEQAQADIEGYKVFSYSSSDWLIHMLWNIRLASAFGNGITIR